MKNLKKYDALSPDFLAVKINYLMEVADELERWTKEWRVWMSWSRSKASTMKRGFGEGSGWGGGRGRGERGAGDWGSERTRVWMREGAIEDVDAEKERMHFWEGNRLRNKVSTIKELKNEREEMQDEEPEREDEIKREWEIGRPLLSRWLPRDI